MMFAPIYRHVQLAQLTLLQKEVDYLLEVGANGSHGYVSPSLIDQSRGRLVASGFRAASLTYTTNASQPQPRGEAIMLSITYPIDDLLLIDTLIGISHDSSSKLIRASGLKMSEFVP